MFCTNAPVNAVRLALPAELMPLFFQTVENQLLTFHSGADGGAVGDFAGDQAAG
jgi:hypothetical protein